MGTTLWSTLLDLIRKIIFLGVCTTTVYGLKKVLSQFKASKHIILGHFPSPIPTSPFVGSYHFVCESMLSNVLNNMRKSQSHFRHVTCTLFFSPRED